MKITPMSPPDAALADDVENSWILPDQKIMFISIGKNACTSIKWLLAEISGQDVGRILAGDSLQSTQRMLIHRRPSWRNTPKLTQLDDELRSQISPANGWFVFAVVRDPRLRAFSAWQSKFLVGEPSYSGRKYAGRDWLPRTPETNQDVLDDWAKFVGAIERGRSDGGISIGDGHFAPHTERLHESVVPYSKIYDISEIGQLTDDLATHLRATVGSAPVLELARENDTPLGAGREVFPPDLLARLEAIYASDFERFGDLWAESFARSAGRPISWTPDALRDIASRRAINEHVSVLDAKLSARGRRIKQLNQQNSELQAQLELVTATAGTSRRPWYADAVSGGKRVARRVLPG